MPTAAAGPMFSIPPSPPSTPVLHRLRAAAGDIKLAHSVFALPFAVLGAFLARTQAGAAADAASVHVATWRQFAQQLALIVVCMVLARTWAMLINRIADRRFDAANPRTTRRALPSGRLPTRDARLIAASSAVLFIAACSLFGLGFDNWWPLVLAVPVLAWIALYSYTKRFTVLCHAFLGGALAVSPLAAAIAVHPPALASTPALWLIAGMVLFWVAGFDTIYALQDTAFDRQHGLSSIPARFGPRGAIMLSRALHLVAFALLVLAARADPRFSLLFALAVAGVGMLLIVEHAILARRGEAGLNMAFFTINGIVSVLLGAAGIADILLA